MYDKLTRLSFIIGLFFFIVSLVLFANAFLSATKTGLNVYTAVVFLLFSLVMMFVIKESRDEHD